MSQKFLAKVKPSIIVAYLLTGVLFIWSMISGNGEFLIYAATALFVVVILTWADVKNDFVSWTIWAFDIWIVLHILGGLWVIDGKALYSHMIYEYVGEPYQVLKYDQFVHFYCYFVIALLLWQVLRNYAGDGASIGVLKFFTVLAAAGIGGLNEIVEFAATVLVPEVNVGGYENTAIDIVCNTLGALTALLFMPMVDRERGR